MDHEDISMNLAQIQSPQSSVRLTHFVLCLVNLTVINKLTPPPGFPRKTVSKVTTCTNTSSAPENI